MVQVRFHPSVLALGVAVLLLASSADATSPAAAATSARVRFLFDLGDGTYAWENATIADPSAPNATWNALLAAAASAGLSVDWAWSSTYGVYILDVGNRSPPGGVGLYQWNVTTDQWDALLVGISSLVLHEGGAVAVSDNGFDPVTYNTLYPVPTPNEPYPVLEFRGDAANTGRSSSTAPGLFQVQWVRDLNLSEIPASPEVGYGRVFALTLDGLFALDLSSGALVWKNLSFRGLSTPALFNGTLLFGGTDGRLHAVYAANGTEAWNVTLIAHPLFSGVTASPKLLFDTAYVGTFNESGGAGDVYAVWATNGTVRWMARAPGSVSFSSAALANGTVYVGVIGRYNTTTQITYDPPYGVLALNAATGSQRWFVATNASVAASPLIDGSELIVPVENGFVEALDAGTGAFLWRAPAAAGVSSPALAGDAVVVGGGSYGEGGRVTALDATTGASLWTFTPNGPVQSSVAAAGGKVFFSTNTASGAIYALNATSGRLDWSFAPSPAQFIFGSPVVADGLVVAPSDNGHVYAFAPAGLTAAAVNLTGPSQLAVGQTGNVSLRVSAPNGTWDDARVTVTVPLGLDVVSTSPAATQAIREFTADLGPVVFGQSRWFNLTVRSNASATTFVDAQVVLRAEGTPWFYSPALLAVRVPSTPSGYTEDWALLATIGAVAVLVIVALLVWLDRRQRHGP